MKRKDLKTLSRYVAELYLRCVAMVGASILGVVYLFETWEIARKAGDRMELSLFGVLGLGVLKLPETWQIVAPFILLFAALYAFWVLARHSELIVFRASGLSVWDFLRPMIAVSLAIGAVHVALINPLGAAMLSRFEQYENTLLSPGKNYVSLLKGGLWLRQNDDAAGRGYAILHARTIDIDRWILNDVMTLSFTNDHQFVERIDARKATLTDKGWRLEDCTVNRADLVAEKRAEVILPTSLTRRDIEDHFASPQTISVWKLPGYIGALESTGFDSTATKIHFFSLLADPAMFAAMIILAACVGLRSARAGRQFVWMAAGIFAGFAVFFLTQFIEALGSAQQIPVLLAALSPPVICGLAAVSILLTVEDG